MLRETFVVGCLDCNCVVLADAKTREAIVVDPGGDPERILAFIARERLAVSSIVHTHAHLDHVGGTAAIAAKTGAETCLHRADVPLYEHLSMQSSLLGLPKVEPWRLDRTLEDQDVVRFGQHEAQVLHTPGHSPGSISLYLRAAKLCLAGDTLFAGDIGRTDVFGGDGEAIVRSIRQKLYTLDGDTEVIPGHGPSTTIGRERDTNPYV